MATKPRKFMSLIPLATVTVAWHGVRNALLRLATYNI